MEMAGVKVVAFVELDDTYAQTHLHNFPDSVRLGSDITKVSDETFKSLEGEVDIIFAGFPCQSFSNAGKKNPNDKRSTLFYEFLRAAKIIKPKWIIGENVKGILRMKTKEGNSVKDTIVQEFENVGYKMVEPFILSCSKYGVPQARERCFFVGRLSDTNNFNPNNLPTKNKVGLQNIVETHLNNAVQIENIFNIEVAIEISNDTLITGKPATNLTKCLQAGKLSFGKRVSPTHSEIVDIRNPCKTIICSYGRMSRLFVPLKNNNNEYFIRELSPRELQQIQGFPKDYVFLGNTLQKVNQIGNAVPPLVVKKIVDEIKKVY